MSEFAAFLSYARLDDNLEDGRVNEFAKRLQNAIRQWTGQSGFHIFQDTKDIRWGQQWKEHIEKALGEVLILIPIMTPLYFSSSACREEYELFLEREQKLKRNDLVLPVYWIDCDCLEDRRAQGSNPWAAGLASHQRSDCRQLRLMSFDTPEVRQAMDGMALQIKQVLGTATDGVVQAAAGKRDLSVGLIRLAGKTDLSGSVEAAVESASQATQGERTSVTEPPTCYVDAMGRGDFISLTEAVKACKPGDRLLVRPGYYPGGLVLDKPLEIVGMGNRNDIVVSATGSGVVLFKANMGIMRNLTLRQVGGGLWFSVDITQGRLVLEECDISSQSLTCIAVHANADPIVRRNCIHDGKELGVHVFENGQGIFEENDISANASEGIAVQEGGNPVVRRNRIHDGKAGGIFVTKRGQGIFEENDIFANASEGIEVQGFGNPVVRRNRIHDGKAGGIFINKNGKGIFEENEVFANEHSGMTVVEGGNPVARHNTVTKNGYYAIWVLDQGKGTFEDNDLRGNKRGSWSIAVGCEVVRKRNKEDPPPGPAC